MKHLSIIFCALLIANSVSSSTPFDQLFEEATAFINSFPKIGKQSLAVLDEISNNITLRMNPISEQFDELVTLLKRAEEIDDPKIAGCKEIGKNLYINVGRQLEWIAGCFKSHRDNAHAQVEKLFKYVDDLYVRLASLRDKTHEECIHGVKSVLQVPGGFICAGSQAIQAVAELPGLVDRAVRTTASLVLLAPKVATCTTAKGVKAFLTRLFDGIKSFRSCVQEVAGDISTGFNEERKKNASNADPAITDVPPFPDSSI